MAARKKIRYAIVGLGHIAQSAVLPGFKSAKKNSEIVAFVSDDPIKHQELGEQYKVTRHYSYDRYDECINSGEVDAVYIALPNHMHCEYVVRAARAGLHVLCEKPLGLTFQECREMIRACDEGGVKLMTAYRLHFEKTNLEAIELIKSGKLGEARIFNSTFSFQVREGDIRVREETGGGTLYDIGIYCINAARYLFQDEPCEVFATTFKRIDERFKEVDGIASAILKFPGYRVATFTTSFASASIAQYTVLGTKGHLQINNCYEYSSGMEVKVTIDGKEQKRKTSKWDQFGAEICYFSQCILEDKTPEPSGTEGLIDVQIIEALYTSARENRPLNVEAIEKQRRPSLKQEIELPPVKEPELINVVDPAVD